MRVVLMSGIAAAMVLPMPASASAQVASEKAAAQALFEEGMRLMAAHRFEEACPKLEESERVDPAMGTRFRLAECYEATGRVASAWAGYLEVADLARAASRGDRETYARARAARIEPLLSRLTIEVATPDTPGLEVRRGDTVIGKAQWAAAIPVDPGSYTIAVSAPGKKPWTNKVSIEAGDPSERVDVPPLEDAENPMAVPPPAERIPIVVSSPPPLPRPIESSARRTAGLSLLGGGAALVAASAVMGIVAKVDYAGAGTHCFNDVCDATGQAITDHARGLADAATVVFAVGAAAGVAGAVVWLTAPNSRSGHSQGPRTAAQIALGPRSLVLRGEFP